MKMTFQEIRIIATGPCIMNQLRDVNTICRRSWYIAIDLLINQLRDVNTICRRSWYIAAHIWKIYDFKIEVYHKF
jgi:hypothetical protein